MNELNFLVFSVMVESFTPRFLLVAFLFDFFYGLVICSLCKFYLCIIYLIMQTIFFMFMCVDFIYVCKAYVWYICLCVFIYIQFIFKHTVLCTVCSFINTRFMFSFLYVVYIFVPFLCVMFYLWFICLCNALISGCQVSSEDVT